MNERVPKWDVRLCESFSSAYHRFRIGLKKYKGWKWKMREKLTRYLLERKIILRFCQRFPHTLAREKEKRKIYPIRAQAPIQNAMFNACELKNKKEIAGERLTELRFFLSILLQLVLFFCRCTEFSVLFAVQ